MIYRIEVRSKGVDPAGQAAAQQISEFGLRVGNIAVSRIFLVDTDADENAVKRIARELLSDPIVEDAVIADDQTGSNHQSRIEIHLKPGVMDPVAASTEMAIRD